MELTLEFIAQQKKILEQKREELLKDLARLKKQDPYKIESRQDGSRNQDELLEDVAEDVGHSLSTTQILELENNLDQVDKALIAISNNTYGVDEKTGESISLERLKAFPEATTSV